MLTLNVPAATDNRPSWTTRDVSTAAAIKGFHSVTLTLRDREPTAEVLSGILGYRLQAREGNRYRFTTNAIETAHIIAILEEPIGRYGINAGGPTHHGAVRVRDDNVLMEGRQHFLDAVCEFTEQI